MSKVRRKMRIQCEVCGKKLKNKKYWCNATCCLKGFDKVERFLDKEMKKTLLIMFVVLFSLAIPAQAGVYVGFQSSAFRPDDDDFRLNRSNEFQFMPAGIVGYSFNDNWAVELEGGTQRFECKYFPVSFQDSYFLFNGVYKYPFNKKLSLYAITGVGMHFYHDRNIDWYYSHFWGNNIENKSSVALKFGCGTEWKLTKNLSINTEGSYRYGDTGDGSSFDVWGWAFTSGIKYYF
jgi:opacity protein-like surface antigen